MSLTDLSAKSNKETKALIEKAAKVLRTTQTEILKRSIRESCDRVLDEKGKKPYELIRHLQLFTGW